MSCVVRWWDVLFVKGMHFSSKNARLLNLLFALEKILTQTAKELIDVSVKCFVKLRLYTSAS